MTFVLDAVDRRILALLVEDGRKPAAEMARHIPGVSERSIRYRIERLKRSGVLRVSAIINPQALGYATIGDVVIDVAPGCLQEVAAQLVDARPSQLCGRGRRRWRPQRPGLCSRYRGTGATDQRGDRGHPRGDTGEDDHRAVEAQRSVRLACPGGVRRGRGADDLKDARGGVAEACKERCTGRAPSERGSQCKEKVRSHSHERPAASCAD